VNFVSPYSLFCGNYVLNPLFNIRHLEVLAVKLAIES
jgi:hypothetical protein